MVRSFLTPALVVALAAGSANADEKADKKQKPKADASVDAFFDTPPAPKSTLDDLNKATAGVGTKEKKPDGMAPKTADVNDDAGVVLYTAFAAQTIVLDKKLGCQPGGKDKKKLAYFAFDDLPEIGQPFQVCVTLSSKAGREMSMSVAVVDPRNARVVKAEDVIDFRGRSGRIDHVLDFPAPQFKTAGQYVYLVELDGKEVGRLPLFTVKIEDPAAATSTSTTPPATATEP